MHLLLTGATGFIGAEVLRQALALHSVTHITVLTRKPLAVEHAKLSAIITRDITGGEPETQTQLRLHGDIDACIWAAGIVSTDLEINQRVNCDIPMAGLTMLKALTKDSSRTTPFRFVFLSGLFPEKKQDKTLLIMSGPRKVRGKGESQIIQAQQPGVFETFIARPSFVNKPKSEQTLVTSTLTTFRNLGLATLGLPTIDLDIVARALLKTAVDDDVAGLATNQCIENSDLVKLGAV